MDNRPTKADLHLPPPLIQTPERLTVIEAVDFKEKVSEILSQPSSPSSVVLDFGLTEFIDSSGIGALVNLFKLSQQKEVIFSLVNVRPEVKAVLSMTQLDQVFNIIDLENSPSTSATLIPETHPSVKSLTKRVIDIVGALVGLGITAIVFIPIALAIKIDSPGPIFFKQERCGWLGRRFKIIKFRSMCTNAESLKSDIPNEVSGAFFKNKNDPRITKVGKFIRKTSLDELPQFWNVLKGEMSLVGTRPPTPDEVEKYGVPEWQRLNVKPGMTGQWQVFGRSEVRSFEDVIQLDLDYQKKWSLKYDIELILRTIFVIFNKNSGAV
jgi:anti-anti-sigma factor